MRFPTEVRYEDLPVNLKRRHRALNRIKGQRKARPITLTVLPELRTIDPPARVPGDKPFTGPPNPFNVVYYRPDGTWFTLFSSLGPREDLDPAADDMLRYGAPGEQIGRTVLNRDGVRVVLSTVFLMLDYGFDGGAPVLWETMVFQSHRRDSDGIRWPASGQQWRYASREAAAAGHQALASLLTTENRRRRADRLARPRTARLRTPQGLVRLAEDD